MVDINDNLNDDDNHGQQQQEVEQQQPAADAIIADSDSDSDSESESDSDSDSNSNDEEDNGDNDGDDDEDNNEEENEEGDSDDESAVVADTMLVRANRRAKLLSLLDQYNDCPFRTRNNIDDLVAEVLERAEDDAHAMICDQNIDNYRGLDINRDTVKEVETIVRIFPNLLSKRKETKWDYNEYGEDGWIAADDGEGQYPIQCLLDLYGPTGYRYNFKALPFVATLAQLGKKLDQFEEDERGGLLIEDEDGWNTLRHLVRSSHSSDEEELNQRMDILCLSQFMHLQQMGLFKQEDIPRYELVYNLCDNHVYFAEKRFQFLVEWCPTSLVHINAHGQLPLHIAAHSTIQAFRIVFEYLIRYYPTKKGISSLFTKNNYGMTPFQMSCVNYERDVVMRIVENILNNSVIPLNIREAVVMAVMDGNVHLDCIYFLLRREPHVWVRLLSLGPDNNNNTNEDGDGDGDGGVDDHGSDDTHDDVDVNNEGHVDDHVDNIDEDEDNDVDDNGDMNNDDGNDDDATDGAAANDDDNDDDDYGHNCSNSDIVRNNNNLDEKQGKGDGEGDKSGDGTHYNEVVSKKRKR